MLNSVFKNFNLLDKIYFYYYKQNIMNIFASEIVFVTWRHGYPPLGSPAYFSLLDYSVRFSWHRYFIFICLGVYSMVLSHMSKCCFKVSAVISNLFCSLYGKALNSLSICLAIDCWSFILICC